MIHSRRPAGRPARGPLQALVAIAIGASLTAGCATGPQVTGFGQVTIGPGYTGTCESAPCQVFYKMPPGTGSSVVTGNEVPLGTYPAGQTVLVGSFWESQAIKVPGTDVAPAYVYIPQER